MVDRVVDLMNCTDSLKEHIIWKLFCKYLQVLYRVEVYVTIYIVRYGNALKCKL